MRPYSVFFFVSVWIQSTVAVPAIITFSSWHPPRYASSLLTSYSTLCIWPGHQPRSSVAVMPVFDHQLGGGGDRASHFTAPGCLTPPHPPTPTCHSLQSAVSFQTPLATAALQTGWRRSMAQKKKNCKYRPVIQTHAARFILHIHFIFVSLNNLYWLKPCF